MSAINRNNPEQKSQIAKTYLSCFRSSKCPTKPLLFQEAQNKNRALLPSKSTQQQQNSSRTRRCKAVLHHGAHCEQGILDTESSPSSSPEKAAEQAVW